MSEPTKGRFSRLLAACERLTREEAAALSRRNFAALTRTQQVKSAILADMAAQAESRPLGAEERIRLTRLLNITRENELLLSNLKAATSEKLRKSRAATHRLHTMRPAYTSATSSREQAFLVHG
jgi:hypothetical protein